MKITEINKGLRILLLVFIIIIGNIFLILVINDALIENIRFLTKNEVIYLVVAIFNLSLIFAESSLIFPEEMQ